MRPLEFRKTSPLSSRARRAPTSQSPAGGDYQLLAAVLVLEPRVACVAHALAPDF
jgi:hypothetical protein